MHPSIDEQKIFKIASNWPFWGKYGPLRGGPSTRVLSYHPNKKLSTL